MGSDLYRSGDRYIAQRSVHNIPSGALLVLEKDEDDPGAWHIFASQTPASSGVLDYWDIWCDNIVDLKDWMTDFGAVPADQGDVGV